MGYRGKLDEQAEARRLRAKGLTMNEIAERVGVSKSSVSLWTRDVPFQPTLLRPRARRRGPNILQRRREERISVVYSCARTHRAVMGLVDALLASRAIPG
jgi:transposase